MKLAPDGIVLNGTLLTMEHECPSVEALAWKNGRIVGLGTERDIMSLTNSETPVIDLEGKVAAPGFIDNHVHPLYKAYDDRCVNLSTARCIEDIQTAIAAQAKRTPPGEWIITSSDWHDDQLREKRLPTRWELDWASDQHPVAVRRGGLVMVVNSIALNLAGISASTPHPDGGTIFKDPETGVPNGILDAHAKDLVERLFPPYTHERKVEALRTLLPKLSACGITSLRDAALLPEEMRAYQTLLRRDELNVRVNMLLYIHPRLTVEQGLELIKQWGPVSGFGDSFLKIGALKFGCDGGFEQALMSEPYVHCDGAVPADQFYGLERTEKNKMRALILEANRHDWQVAVHCVGDRAIDIALDIYEEANAESPIGPKRWSLEHAIYPRPDQIERVHRLGILVTVQPHTSVAASSMIKHWGEKRAQRTYPLRSWLEKGVRLAGGSDSPTTPYNPFSAIQFWTTRRARNGMIMGPEQAISVEQALRLHTVENVYLTFEEDLKGSLRVGKWADLVVFSANPLETPAEELEGIQVLKTLVGGKLTFVR